MNQFLDFHISDTGYIPEGSSIGLAVMAVVGAVLITWGIAASHSAKKEKEHQNELWEATATDADRAKGQRAVVKDLLDAARRGEITATEAFERAAAAPTGAAGAEEHAGTADELLAAARPGEISAMEAFTRAAARAAPRTDEGTDD